MKSKGSLIVLGLVNVSLTFGFPHTPATFSNGITATEILSIPFYMLFSLISRTENLSESEENISAYRLNPARC